MDAAHDDSLRHAFQHHAEQEHASDLDVAWKVHEDFSQRGDFWTLVSTCVGQWNGQSSSALKVLNCVADVTQLRRLDCLA